MFARAVPVLPRYQYHIAGIYQKTQNLSAVLNAATGTHPERRGKQIAIAVRNEREELRTQNLDPDKAFAKRREEAAEVAAR
jgi:hypothetical protein